MPDRRKVARIQTDELLIIYNDNNPDITKGPKPMQLLYIAAPYRADTTAQIRNNIHEASLMAQYYWLQGYAVICPHLNSAHFDGLVPDTQFLAGTKLMLATCGHIALHPRWSSSQGCIIEYEYALNNKIIPHFTVLPRVYKALGMTVGD